MPDIGDDDARRRFATAPVARLATVGPDGRPHLVPVVFAVVGGHIVTAVDGKPKSTGKLRRLANIRANPAVSVLVDNYEPDWSRLWWVRADGIAAIHDDGPVAADARRALVSKYAQYQEISLDGPVITIAVRRWSGWAARA